jgi:Prp8 binding protein
MATGSGTELVATGSDDGTVKIWEGGDDANKIPVATLDVGCPVTGVCWSADGANVYVGAIDNEIHVRFLPPLPPQISLTCYCP